MTDIDSIKKAWEGFSKPWQTMDPPPETPQSKVEYERYYLRSSRFLAMMVEKIDENGFKLVVTSHEDEVLSIPLKTSDPTHAKHMADQYMVLFLTTGVTELTKNIRLD